MKLKNIVFVTLAVGSLVTATPSMATCEIQNLTQMTLLIECAGQPTKMYVPIPLPWGLVESQLMGGHSDATCTLSDFFDRTIATADVHVNADLNAGYIDNLIPATGYTMSTAHSGANPPGTPYWENVVLTINH